MPQFPRPVSSGQDKTSKLSAFLKPDPGGAPVRPTFHPRAPGHLHFFSKIEATSTAEEFKVIYAQAIELPSEEPVAEKRDVATALSFCGHPFSSRYGTQDPVSPLKVFDALVDKIANLSSASENESLGSKCLDLMLESTLMNVATGGGWKSKHSRIAELLFKAAGNHKIDTAIRYGLTKAGKVLSSLAPRNVRANLFPLTPG